MLDHTSYAITEFPLFDSLSPHIAQYFLARGVERSYRRGEVICLQGEPARTLKVITRGWAKLYRVSAVGDESILATLERGNCFDELPALRGGNSKLSAEAMTDCTILHFDLNAICSCDGADEEIAAAVMAAASRKMDDLIVQLEGLKSKTGMQRLCEYLVDLAGDGAGRDVTMELPFGKVVLAGQLGMQPESLSRAFKKLKPMGVSSNRRHVAIRDVATLRRYLDEELACV